MILTAELLVTDAEQREMDLSNARRAHRLARVSTSDTEPFGSKAIAAYLDSSDHGLVVIEVDGTIALCSSRARTLLGLDAGLDVIGRSLRAVLLELGRAWRERCGLVRTRPRGGLRRSAPLIIEAAAKRISLAIRTLPGAGWVLTVEESRTAPVGKAIVGRRDPVTGLPDSADFRARLTETLDRPGAQIAVLAIGLDRFKQVTDTLGHRAGDAVLRMVAGRLRSTLRRHDDLSRLSGDAFAVAQEWAGKPSDAEPLAHRIVDLLGRAYVVEGELINIVASVGVALSTERCTDPDALLRRAHLALDRARSDGGATSRFFETEMDGHSQARRSLEIDLRRAMALDQFELVYQPQLDLRSDRLVGCEALIRWRHPTRGIVSPAEFIPLAEEIGLINTIGEWVLRTACREAARWPHGVTVAVNLSPAQFRSLTLVGAVASALASSGLSPHRLELEITEGLVLHENKANFDTLDALRALGPRIAMDDFGTGHASLSALRAFPFDSLKIDRSFISGPGAERDAMAVVRAITTLGSTYGMAIVAEGIETAEQMRDVRSGGCAIVQGYHIGRPMPAVDMARLFAEQAEMPIEASHPLSPELSR